MVKFYTGQMCAYLTKYGQVVTGVTGERVEVARPLQLGPLREDLQRVYESGAVKCTGQMYWSITLVDCSV